MVYGDVGGGDGRENITLFYCRLLSLVQMVKITIISSYETSFFLGTQHKKVSVDRKIHNASIQIRGICHANAFKLA
jgi:hypothetical protein